jgi:hypothetical protein
MIGILVLLTAVLLVVGYEDRHEVGPVPMILGGLWVLFILASAPKIFSRDDHERR